MTNGSPDDDAQETSSADFWPKFVLLTAGLLTVIWIGAMALGAWSVVDHFVH
jgi:hypothetical protein